MESIWEFIIFIIIILIILYVLFQWIYHKNVFSPSDIIETISERHEDLYLGIKSGKVSKIKNIDEENINVWLFDNYPGKKVVLFFHGNSGNISNRSYIIDICKNFKLNLLLVDYRGYGQSDGNPRIGHLPKDGEIAYNFIRTKFDSDKIVIWGESLGGSVAISVASRFECRCLILLSTFSNISDLIKYHHKINSASKVAMAGFIRLTGNEVNSKEWIKRVKCPVLMLHSTEDRLISFKSAKILFNNIRTHKKLIKIKGDHSMPDIKDSQLEELFDFIGMGRIEQHGQSLDKLSDTLRDVAKNRDWGKA